MQSEENRSEEEKQKEVEEFKSHWRNVTNIVTASKYNTRRGEYKAEFRAEKKQLPNQKCACGSGKKYKHCCLNKEES